MHKPEYTTACTHPTIDTHALHMLAHATGPSHNCPGLWSAALSRRPCPATTPILPSRSRCVSLASLPQRRPFVAKMVSWARGRHRLNVEPARMHGAFSGQAGTCDGRKESLRLLQQARSTRGARGSPDRLGRGEGREEGEEGAPRAPGSPATFAGAKGLVW
jgi:hypothetical protein